jgi:hypothetical protein
MKVEMKVLMKVAYLEKMMAAL